MPLGLHEVTLEDLKELYNRKDHVSVDDEGVTLTGGGYDYWIARDRIDSNEKLVHWVHHLCEKVWFDTFTARRMIEKVTTVYGLGRVWP